MNLAGFGATIGRMSMGQRVVAALGTLAALAAFVGVLRLATAPTMALLYSGLDPAAAGEVVQSLDQQGALYEVRGGAIYVDSSQRDALRLSLAAEGKPQNGAAGYEILDSLSGFGTTSQMFDAAYWRAKEGELARTIMSSPLVRSARVHVSNGGTRPFVRAATPGASVSLIPAGAGIPPEQAAAIRFLVAAAVAGLDPANVTIVDARAGRVIAGEEATAGQAGDRLADELRRRAERMLEARVGPGNAIVEVSVDTITESEEIVERRLDPDSRVLISTEVEERAAASTAAQPSNVTVASNLPDGDAGTGAGQSTSDDTETRERSNFDVSETTREVRRVPGGVARLTVAVLVNETDPAPEGGAAARTEEELAALRELVASAVGFDEARGDVITLRAMSFSLSEPGEATGAGLAQQLLAGIDLMRIIQIAILGLVAIVLGLFVVRPILTRPLPPMADVPRLSGTGVSALEPAALPPVARAGAPDATQRLVRAMGGNPSDAANVLRGWIRAGEGGA